VRVALAASPLLMILFVVLAICAIVFQIRANRSFELESYDRWAEVSE
jgi:hypothetical protein